jgi:hypothetical protein
VAGLYVKQVRKVHRQARLGDALDEAVRKTVGIQALEGAHAVTPLLGQRDTIAPDQLEPGTTAVAEPNPRQDDDQTVAADQLTGPGQRLRQSF